MAQSTAEEVQNVAKQKAEQIINEAKAIGQKEADSLSSQITLKKKELEDLQKQFDIDPNTVSDFIAEVSEDGDFPTTVIVTKANDEEGKDKINEKLNSYLNEKLSNAQSYNTDQVSTIEACKVQDNGLYSMLVIAKNHEDIEKIINGYFS